MYGSYRKHCFMTVNLHSVIFIHTNNYIATFMLKMAILESYKLEMLFLQKVKMDPFLNIFNIVCCTSSVYLIALSILSYKDTYLNLFPKAYLRKAWILEIKRSEYQS